MLSPRKYLGPNFQPYFSRTLVGFDDDLGKQTKFKGHVSDYGSLYFSPIQPWMEGDCEIHPSHLQGCEGIKVHELFYCSSPISIKIMTCT